MLAWYISWSQFLKGVVEYFGQYAYSLSCWELDEKIDTTLSVKLLQPAAVAVSLEYHLAACQHQLTCCIYFVWSNTKFLHTEM